SQLVDVVAANPVDPELDIEVSAPPARTVTAFVATRSELVVLDVGLDAGGVAQVPSIRARCPLDPVVPTKLAVVPGDDAQVFVADGAGDGVVSIQTASVAGGPCTVDRFTAGGRQVRSVALSPRWYDQDASGQTRTRPAGELLMMVVEPLATAQPGRELDTGGVLFAGTGRGLVLRGILPIPPFDPTKDVAEPMQPISLPAKGLTREGTFLRAIKPRPGPLPPDVVNICTAPPCTREPGVTHRGSWRAIWHSRIPALGRRAGTVTQAGADILRFTTTPADLAAWRDDPAIALGAGDVVAFAAVSLAADTSAPCQDMVSSEKMQN